MLKTLAQLKRDAAGGKMFVELVERYGETAEQIPERLRGARRVIGANTVELKIARADDSTQSSGMRYGAASLIEYSGDSLTVYSAGRRELTESEQRECDRAQAYRTEHEAKNPYSDSYWAMKSFWAKSSMPYLGSYEKTGGKVLRHNCGVPYIEDDAIKGETILKYKVWFEEAATV